MARSKLRTFDFAEVTLKEMVERIVDSYDNGYRTIMKEIANIRAKKNSSIDDIIKRISDMMEQDGTDIPYRNYIQSMVKYINRTYPKYMSMIRPYAGSRLSWKVIEKHKDKIEYVLNTVKDVVTKIHPKAEVSKTIYYITEKMIKDMAKNKNKEIPVKLDHVQNIILPGKEVDARKTTIAQTIYNIVELIIDESTLGGILLQSKDIDTEGKISSNVGNMKFIINTIDRMIAIINSDRYPTMNAKASLFNSRIVSTPDITGMIRNRRVESIINARGIAIKDDAEKMNIDGKESADFDIRISNMYREIYPRRVLQSSIRYWDRSYMNRDKSLTAYESIIARFSIVLYKLLELLFHDMSGNRFTIVKESGDDRDIYTYDEESNKILSEITRVLSDGLPIPIGSCAVRNRGFKHIAKLASQLNGYDGKVRYVKADISKFFETVKGASTAGVYLVSGMLRSYYHPDTMDINTDVHMRIIKKLSIIGRKSMIINNSLGPTSIYRSHEMTMATGFPLTPLFADISMHKFDRKMQMIANNFLNGVYIRYVDDILILYTRNIRYKDVLDIIQNGLDSYIGSEDIDDDNKLTINSNKVEFGTLQDNSVKFSGVKIGKIGNRMFIGQQHRKQIEKFVLTAKNTTLPLFNIWNKDTSGMWSNRKRKVVWKSINNDLERIATVMDSANKYISMLSSIVGGLSVPNILYEIRFNNYTNSEVIRVLKNIKDVAKRKHGRIIDNIIRDEGNSDDYTYAKSISKSIMNIIDPFGYIKKTKEKPVVIHINDITNIKKVEYKTANSIGIYDNVAAALYAVWKIISHIMDDRRRDTLVDVLCSGGHSIENRVINVSLLYAYIILSVEHEFNVKMTIEKDWTINARTRTNQ